MLVVFSNAEIVDYPDIKEWDAQFLWAAGLAAVANTDNAKLPE